MIRTEIIDAGPQARIAVIHLARPEKKKNALTIPMLTDLLVAIEQCGRDAARVNIADAPPTSRISSHDLRALILAGDGDAFCSGFDLSLCRDDTTVLAGLLTHLSNAVRALRKLPMPAICAAHGAAIAGGCALLGGADFVVTDANAKLGYPVVRLGISPAVTAPFLSQALGHGRTRERLLGGSLIDGREALRLGLAHECVDRPEQVLPRALEIAHALAANPPGALAATKRWLNELDGSTDEARADSALAASLSLVGSEEERSRLAALWGAKS